MRGRGEKLEPVRPLVSQWLTVGLVPHKVVHKTAALYAALEPADLSDGGLTARAAACLNAGEPLRDELLVNTFGRAARQVFPGLADAWQIAELALGRRLHLSGAGPALFLLATDRTDAARSARALGGIGFSTFVTRTVRHARARANLASSLPIEYS